MKFSKKAAITFEVLRPLHNLPRALKKSPESEFIDFLGDHLGERNVENSHV